MSIQHLAQVVPSLITPPTFRDDSHGKSIIFRKNPCVRTGDWPPVQQNAAMPHVTHSIWNRKFDFKTKIDLLKADSNIFRTDTCRAIRTYEHPGMNHSPVAEPCAYFRFILTYLSHSRAL